MMNKKAIEHAVLAIILAVALVGVGITIMTLRIPLASPTAQVVLPQDCLLDCDDSDPTVYPGAPEILDGKDNDCDGETDEGLCGNGVVDPGEQGDPPFTECENGQNLGIVTDDCQCDIELCPFTGNGFCDVGENNANSPQDCPKVCGNNVCEAAEGNTCPEDCVSVCGNGVCETGQHDPNENNNNCPVDCADTTHQCSGTGHCQYDRTVYDPGDEGRPNCPEDCCGAACETDDDCDDSDPCTSEFCDTETGGDKSFCVYTAEEGCCDEDSDCDDGKLCTDDMCNIIVLEGFSLQQTGTCSNTPNDENSCTDGDPCTTDECIEGDCVSTGECPPQQGGGGGQQYIQCSETAPPDYVPTNKPCTACRNDEICAEATSKSASGATLEQCRCWEKAETATAQAPPASQPETSAPTPPYFSQLPSSNTAPPPELPRGAGAGNQESFAGQAALAQQESQRRERAAIEGALAQESSASPAAWTLLFLIALLGGIYAYFNREQLSDFFKKEEKKAEPVVKEIQHEWQQITKPAKAHAKHKAKRRHK